MSNNVSHPSHYNAHPAGIECIMFDNLRCKLGFHKPVTVHRSYKYKCRTTNKGRSKKRYLIWAKILVTETYCERCGKILRTKSKLKRRW